MKMRIPHLVLSCFALLVTTVLLAQDQATKKTATETTQVTDKKAADKKAADKKAADKKAADKKAADKKAAKFRKQAIRPKPRSSSTNNPLGQARPQSANSNSLIRALFREWLFADEAYRVRNPVNADTGSAIRDPFDTTSTMQNVARMAGPQFVPSEDTAGVPKLALKGLLEGEDGEPVGLISVENFGTFMVVKGEQISLQNGRSNLVLMVKEITPNTISVEVGTLGQLIMVR